MMTLTIELPDELVQQVRGRGISQQRLESAIIELIRACIREWDAIESTAKQSAWSDGEAFARRVIANNRKLFEELAQL
jgi:hypothetical protein